MKTFRTLTLPASDTGDQAGRAKTAVKILKVLALLALLVIALLFPLQISPDTATTSLAVYTLMFAGWAVAWNIFSGYSGYIALGHAAFFGSGAYALAIMCQRWHIGSHDIALLFVSIPADYTPFLLVPLAGLIAGLVAVPVGWVALHTRRHTFIVVTIAIFFIFQLLSENLRGITGGEAGIELPLPTWIYPFYNYPFYYAMLAILLLALATSWWVRHSKYGLGLLAIRDDEDRALGLGVKTGPSKVVAYALSAVFAGMIGGVWGYFTASVFPQSAFDPLNDITLVLMGFMGGLGTLFGPVIGALITEPAKQYLEFLPAIQNSQNASGYYLIIYGVVFLAVILLLPEGIIPTLRKWWMRWRAARVDADAASGDADAAMQTASVGAKPAETGEEVNL